MIDDFRINQLLTDVALRELRKSPDNVARLRRGEPISFAYLEESPMVSCVLEPRSRIEDIPINSFRIEWNRYSNRIYFQQGMSPWIIVNPDSMTCASEWKRVLGSERVSLIEPIPCRDDPQVLNAIRRSEEYMQRSSGMFETHATASRVVAGKRYSAMCRIASHGMVYHGRYGQRLGHAMACVKGDDATITWDSEAMQRGKDWERRGTPWQKRVPR